MLILNIGLATILNNFKGADLPQGAYLAESTVFHTLQNAGFATVWIKRGNSDTEPNLIVGLDQTRGLAGKAYYIMPCYGFIVTHLYKKVKFYF